MPTKTKVYNIISKMQHKIVIKVLMDDSYSMINIYWRKLKVEIKAVSQHFSERRQERAIALLNIKKYGPPN